MCGIWAFININSSIIDIKKLYADYINLSNRGPNYSSFNKYNDNIYIGFHRLSIMNLKYSGNQPFILENDNKKLIFICNGEIYNYKYLNDKYKLGILNNSDCMTIPKLYLYHRDKFTDLFVDEIKGEFAFVLLELDSNEELINIIAGRDHVGVRPLYYNKNKTNEIYFSSEIKGMLNYTNDICEFPPGNIIYFNMVNKKISSYDYTVIYSKQPEYYKGDDYYLNKIRTALIKSVERRLDADRPLCCLLSGGVDSSLICSIANRILSKKNKTLNTFCCGFASGTDLQYAKKVADYLQSCHTQVIFNEEEAFNSIEHVIYTVESWDTTTIRASVGQYLVCKYIKENSNFKIILVGEGSDEVCSSYLFNYYAPSDKELHECAVEYVKNIHLYDGRRADRCISHFGLEARVSFLDPEFIEAYWTLPAEYRHPKYKNMEKWWLRKAFETSNLLPPEILWRKKEAFSDGISSNKKSWFEIIDEKIKSEKLEYISDFDSTISPTIESHYYKKIFIKYFTEKNINILDNYWQPKWINNNNKYVDPSARILNVY